MILRWKIWTRISFVLLMGFMPLIFISLKGLSSEDIADANDKKFDFQKEEVSEEGEEEELSGGVQTNEVLMRGLNKVTAHVYDIVAPVGQKIKFGYLEVTARLCQKSPPEDPPESTAFLEIQEVKPAEKPSKVFSGWMFASAPALSALEHPVYDIWVLNCQGHTIHELPSLDPGFRSLSLGDQTSLRDQKSLPFETIATISLKDASAPLQELSPKTPTVVAFERGFNHPTRAF